MTVSINKPHAPHCAYICHDGFATLPCDCGAVTQPRLSLSLGVRSVELLKKAIGRLDTDDQREEEVMILKDVLGSFVVSRQPPAADGGCVA